MSDTWIALIALGWIVCGVLNYGITLAHFQGTFPLIAKDVLGGDRVFAALVATVGPVGLSVALWGSGFASHGLKYR